jgi:hypothetical protein
MPATRNRLQQQVLARQLARKHLAQAVVAKADAEAAAGAEQAEPECEQDNESRSCVDCTTSAQSVTDLIGKIAVLMGVILPVDKLKLELYDASFEEWVLLSNLDECDTLEADGGGAVMLAKLMLREALDVISDDERSAGDRECTLRVQMDGELKAVEDAENNGRRISAALTVPEVPDAEQATSSRAEPAEPTEAQEGAVNGAAGQCGASSQPSPTEIMKYRELMKRAAMAWGVSQTCFTTCIPLAIPVP